MKTIFTILIICCLIGSAQAGICILQSDTSSVTAITDSTELIMDSGKEFARLGNFEKAIAEFSRVIDKENKNLDAYMNRAFAFESVKQYPSAIKDFGFVVRKTTEDDFLHTAAMRHRGRMWLLLGIKEEAAKDLPALKAEDKQV